MRIGIVDDSAEDRKLVRMEMERCLESSGMEPAEYNEYDSADAFLSTFEAGMFDLIFLDICMDGASGIDAGLGIRKTDRNVRIVFITSSNDYAAESYQVKAAHYLLKPHTFAQFHEMFLELLPARQRPPEESFVNLPDGSVRRHRLYRVLQSLRLFSSVRHAGGSQSLHVTAGNRKTPM